MVSFVQRYDLKGKEIIGGCGKYYFADMGIRNAASGYKGFDQEPHFMENVIYNELVSRGYLVNIGVVKSVEDIDGKPAKVVREIDFIAEKDGKRFYIQSALVLEDEEKIKKEKAPLKKTNDGFQKIIISKFTSGNYYDDDGILRLGLFDFLLNIDKTLE